MKLVLVLSMVAILGLAAGVALAQEQKAKGPACEEQLAQSQTHGQMVVAHRDKMETQLATLGVELAAARRQNAALTKELEALKAKAKKLSEKPAE